MPALIGAASIPNFSELLRGLTVMVSKHLHRLSRPASMLIGIGALAMLTGCAPATPASSSLAAEAPAQLITQVQEAEALDKAGLDDLTIGLPRRGDFLEHQAKARDVLIDLQHGLPVSQDDLSYALEVPPRHLQPEQRTALVEQLKNAIHEDEQREQGVVAYSSGMFYEDPDAPSQFGTQEERAQREMQNLEVGKHVSWDKVHQALYVPPNPL
jgi:hypothetical protein